MTNFNPQPNDADLELLSAYIDGQLSAPDRAALEQRLEREPALNAALDDLRATVGLLRQLPPARPPRSFTLDAQAVAPRRAWAFPWGQFASGLIAVALVVVFGFALTRTVSQSNLASAPSSAQMEAAGVTAAPAAEAPIGAGAAALAPTAAPAADTAPMAAAAPTSAPAAATAEPQATAAAASEAAPAAAEPTVAAAEPAAGALAAPTGTQGPEPGPDVRMAAGATAEPAAGGAEAYDAATVAPEQPREKTADTTASGDAANGAGDAALAAPSGTPVFTAQLATSGSTSPDTTTLATPTGVPTSGGNGPGWLAAGVLALIIALAAWLATRRR